MVNTNIITQRANLTANQNIT